MQPYPNPNYYAQYMQQPQINPYMQRLDQLQQFQQSMQSGNQFQAIGKMVESIEMVKATDIPIDGNMYYFPKADGTELYAKQWLPNGKTRILTFKPLLEDEPNNSISEQEKLNLGALEEFRGAFLEQIECVNQRLERIENNLKQNSSLKVKKGACDDAE